MPSVSQHTSVPGHKRGGSAVDFVIVGGGVVGLTTALALRDTGAEVAVFERGPGPGCEASGAAAGVLSQVHPWADPPELEAEIRASQALWPTLCARLEQVTGMETGFNPCGLVDLAPGDVNAACAWSERTGATLEVLDAADLAARIPALASSFDLAVGQPGVATLQPRRMLAALAALLKHTGVACHWSTPVESVAVASGIATGVRDAQGVFHPAGAVIVAGGAWSAGLLGPLGVRVEVRPVRGQILQLGGPPGLLDTVLVFGETYIVPWLDGSLLVGSTVEEVGFDCSVTQDAAVQLRDAAAKLLPATRDLPHQAHWAGLRPGTSGMPIVGPAPGLAQLWLNLGHFRNGITLAPASARRLCDALLH